MKSTIEPRCEIRGNDLYLEGFIMSSDDEGYISANAVKNALTGISGDLTVHINSQGGFTTEGVAIYNILKDYNGKVTAQIDGIAGGAAYLLAMGADTIRARRSSMVMLQQPWDIAIGNASEIRATANKLTISGIAVRRTLMEKFNGTEKELTGLMDNDTYMTADEANRKGFIDDIIIDNEKSMKVKSQMKQIMAETKSFFHKFKR